MPDALCNVQEPPGPPCIPHLTNWPQLKQNEIRFVLSEARWKCVGNLIILDFSLNKLDEINHRWIAI